jgi:hypothetical protein
MTSTSFTTLEERTTIEFPRKVRLEELRELLRTVAMHVPCEFSYSLQFAERIGELSPQPPTVVSYAEGLQGVVYNRERRSVQFECRRNTNHDAPGGPVTTFDQLKFNTTPGYSLPELQGRFADDVGLMDAIRTHVTAYFASPLFERS